MRKKGMTQLISNKISTPVNVAIALYKEREIFFLLDSCNNIISSFHSSAGLAMGDLIGPISPVQGTGNINDIEDDVFDIYEKTVSKIKKSTDKTSSALVNIIISEFETLFFIDLSERTGYKNLLLLPLMAEMITDVIRHRDSANFKKSEKILLSIKQYRTPLTTFSEDIMLYGNHDNPVKAYLEVNKNSIPSTVYSGTTRFIIHENDSHKSLYEVFIPDSFDDLISYMVSKYIQNYHFYCCQNCKRYYAFLKDSVTKNCSRIIESSTYQKDIGKRCRDVGRLRARNRELYSDDTHRLFQRQYKATFARKTHGKIPEDTFKKWSKQARIMRDKCLAGEISYRALERWFKDYTLKE